MLIAREIADEMRPGEFLIRPVARDRRLARQVVRLFANPSVGQPITWPSRRAGSPA